MERNTDVEASRSGARASRAGRHAEGGETRRRLIDAGERLFGERGLKAVSIRDITGLAEVNSAAIFYHFGSKEGLIEAILERRAADFAARRAALLEGLEASDEISVRDVVRALVHPTAQFFNDAPGGASYLAFMAAVRDNPEMLPIIERHYDGNIARFLDVLRRVTPHLTDDERVVRFALAKEVIHRFYGLGQRDAMRLWVLDHVADLPDDLTDHLVEFLTCAFSAPAVSTTDT